jgi:Na+-transporting methylmalonyl-CoA/oxaloacetate decarboxylase gamma subunit
MKEFIRDDGKVRECASNIAKMNILEYMWYQKAIIPRVLKESIENLIEGMSLVMAGLITLFLIIILPISYSITAYINIHQAKEEVKFCQKQNKRYL